MSIRHALTRSLALAPSRAHAVLIAAVAAVLVSALPAQAVPPDSAIRYVYDDAGRLKAVTDPAAGSAVFGWDPVGNLTSIARSQASDVTVLGVTPGRGVVGDVVSVQGSGFSSTAASNTVKFNGTTATIQAATPTELVVQVPTGATSGTVSVTAPGGTATSSVPFTVTGSRAPSIDSATPRIAATGSTVTLAGSNFDDRSTSNVVTLNRTRAVVSSAAASSVDLKVPTGTTSGRVSVRTPNGNTVGPDVFIPPAGNTPANVKVADRVAFGQDKALSLPAANDMAILVFDGQAGQRISVNVKNSTLSLAYATILKPDGSKIGLDYNFGTSGRFLEPMTLPVDGTYSLIIDPYGTSTGNATATVHNVPPDLTGTIAPARTPGTAKTAAFTAPGQNAQYAFEATAGQAVSVMARDIGAVSAISIRKADGTLLGSSTALNNTSNIHDQVVIPADGTYYLHADPYGTNTGSTTLLFYDANDQKETVTPSGSGDARTFTLSTPGMNGRASFEGTAGKRIAVKLSGSTFGWYSVSIRKPDGTMVGTNYYNQGTGDRFVEPVTLPTSGTYSVLVDPSGSYTGSVTAKVYEVPDDQVDTINPSASGDARTLTFNTPGQNARLNFEGTAGKAVAVKGSGVTAHSYVSIRKADGTLVGSSTTFYGSTDFLDAVTLPTTGSYYLSVDPAEDKTGPITVTTYDATEKQEAITPTAAGVSVPFSLGIGQNGRATFQGTAGQRISVQTKNSTIPYWGIAIRKPDGSWLAGFNGGGTSDRYLDAVTLPTTGTYSVVIDPNGTNTGSITAKVFDVPTDQTVAINPTTSGDAKTVTFDTPGQNAKLTFEGTAGKAVAVKGSAVTAHSSISIRKADGTMVGSSTTFNGGTDFLDAVTLPSTGTYYVYVDAYEDKTGPITVTTYDATEQKEAITPTAAGVSVPFTLGIGQNGRATFQATAGDRISVHLKDSTISYWGIAIRKPDGSWLAGYNGGGTAGGYLDAVTLPTTGTYSVVVDPGGTNTGSITAKVYGIPPDQTATINPTASGDAEALTFDTPGQSARLTFSGTAGKAISVKGSGVTAHSYVSILKPDGSQLGSNTLFNGGTDFINQTTLPTTGTYTVLVNPYEDKTGPITVTTYDATDRTDSMAIGDPPFTLNMDTPGQNAKVSFSGTAGTGIRLTAGDVTLASTAVTIKRPDGTNLTSMTVTASGGSTTATLPTTGTYSIVVDPASANTGNIALTLAQTAAYWNGGPPQMVPAGSGIDPLGGGWSDIPAGDDWQDAPARREARRVMPVSTTDSAQRRPAARRAAAPRRGKARRQAKVVSSEQRDRAPKPTTTTEPVRPADRQVMPRYRTPNKSHWRPSRKHRSGAWRTDWDETPWRSLPALRSAPGTTALAGQSLRVNGTPLRGATLRVEGSPRTARTDRSGRFLLENVPAGKRVLVIDGRTAKTRGKERFGVFRTRVDLKAGITTVLEYTVWMTALDPAGDVRVDFPTRRDVVMRSKLMPGFEVRIPKGSRITDARGRPVRKLNLSPVPVDRPAFPLPNFVSPPAYFTAQPGDVYLSKGAQIVYPNYTGMKAGTRSDFWNNDPEDKGWHIYGYGRVSADGKQIVPDRDTRVWELTGAMAGTGPFAPNDGPNGPKSGDPVDLSTGLFVYDKTDLTLDDDIPIVLDRTYRQNDGNDYLFGYGMNTPYDVYLRQRETDRVSLVLEDGAQAWFRRTTPGTGNIGAVFEAESTGDFAGATVKFNTTTSMWDVRLRTGMTLAFDQLRGQLFSIRDRFNKQLTINRTDNSGQSRGFINQITSPSGRWVKFDLDSGNRVTRAYDNTGRETSYTYTNGRMVTATDVRGGVTHYAYDTQGRMTSIKDPRGNFMVTNTFDANNRVATQQLANQGVWSFAYTGPSTGTVSKTRVTDARGSVREVEFNAAGFATSDTLDEGGPNEQATTYTRAADTNHLTAITDALGRKSTFQYDSRGNVSSVTRLADTAAANTYNYTWDPDHALVTSVTDPLNHTTSLTYDTLGRMTTVKDATNRTWTFQYSGSGPHPSSITDPLAQVTQLETTDGKLTAMTDPLGNRSDLFLDAAGRVASSIDPLGRETRFYYDAADNVTKKVAPGGAETTYQYDPNGNMTRVTDARGGQINATYNAVNLIESTTDALGGTEQLAYDPNGNVVRATNRKGQVRTFRYDSLDRRTFIGYGTTGTSPNEQFESTTDLTWDLGNRVTQVTDSAGGSLTNGWDGFDRLASQSSANGSVAYTYDGAGRRTSMTAQDKPTVTYGWDDAGRLTSIAHAGMAAAFAYDGMGRMTSTTLPNGALEHYSYDAASRVTGVNWTGLGSLMGISYANDAAGRRTAQWGSAASTALPAAMGSATYDAGNRRTAQDGQALSYDANGNLLNDGTATYGWNARDQLTSTSATGLSASFAYDAWGRRSSRTVNGETVGFLWDLSNVAQELRGGSRTALLTGLQDDQLLGRSDATGTTSYLTDALGSKVGLADSLGSVNTSYTYEPFGSASATGAASQNAFQFAGRDNDETGLHYLRARYYSPKMQRFISEDPIGLAGGDTNVFAYVGGDPVNKRDPSGLIDVMGAVTTGLEFTVGVADGVWFGLPSKIAGLDTDCLSSAYGWGATAGAFFGGYKAAASVLAKVVKRYGRKFLRDVATLGLVSGTYEYFSTISVTGQSPSVGGWGVSVGAGMAGAVGHGPGGTTAVGSAAVASGGATAATGGGAIGQSSGDGCSM